MTDNFVTHDQCKEFRGICADNRKSEREICEKAQESDHKSRDAWITKLERKIDWLIAVIVVQAITFTAGMILLLFTHVLGAGA